MAVGVIEVAGAKLVKPIQRLEQPGSRHPALKRCSRAHVQLCEQKSHPRSVGLSKDWTLNNIMIVMSAVLPLNFNPSNNLIKAAKNATRIMLPGAGA